MDKEVKVKLLIELVQITLEIENLKPHVSETQLAAADRIRSHLRTISTIIDA